MNLPGAILAMGWMVRDTLRQSLASRLFWAMMALSIVCIVFCLSVRVKDTPRLPLAEGEDKFMLPEGDPELKKTVEDLPRAHVDVIGKDELSLGFGAFTLNTRRGSEDSVRFLQVWLAGLVAGTAGIFLAVIWTAGFLPTFLDPNNATVLLAKPVPRWSLLLGKVLGVLTFVFLQTTFFVVGTWLALGFATGVFDGRYLLAIPVLLLHFTVFYAFCRDARGVDAEHGRVRLRTLLFWVLCWGMNFGRHATIANDPRGMSDGSRAALEIGYWVLPKPGDLNVIFDDALDTEGFGAGVPEFVRAREKGELNLMLSALASLLFAFAMFGVAAHEFRNAEY